MENKLNLIWKSGNDNSFIIGEVLNCEERYYFSYNEDEVKMAIEEGFKALDGFPRVNSKYFSEEPFKLFTRWAIDNRKLDKVNFELFKDLTHGEFSFVEVMEDINGDEIA
ncbi:hypothetical protein [Clostridium sp.]|uniref:hypothetical protein n=1 Tax=Clostridium sp. TaxID=1506 RepID=UPI003217662F